MLISCGPRGSQLAAGLAVLRTTAMSHRVAHVRQSHIGVSNGTVSYDLEDASPAVWDADPTTTATRLDVGLAAAITPGHGMCDESGVTAAWNRRVVLDAELWPECYNNRYANGYRDWTLANVDEDLDTLEGLNATDFNAAAAGTSGDPGSLLEMCQFLETQLDNTKAYSMRVGKYFFPYRPTWRNYGDIPATYAATVTEGLDVELGSPEGVVIKDTEIASDLYDNIRIMFPACYALRQVGTGTDGNGNANVTAAHMTRWCSWAVWRCKLINATYGNIWPVCALVWTELQGTSEIITADTYEAMLRGFRAAAADEVCLLTVHNETPVSSAGMTKIANFQEAARRIG